MVVPVANIRFKSRFQQRPVGEWHLRPGASPHGTKDAQFPTLEKNVSIWANSIIWVLM